MTNTEALHDIFTRFDTFQYSIIEGIRHNGGKKETFLLSIGKLDSKIGLLIETEEDIAVKLYHFNTVLESEEKLNWLLNEYQLTVKSMVEIYDFNSKNMRIKVYNENDIMCYSFLLLKLSKEDEVCVRFSVHVDGIDLNEFVDYFKDISHMIAHEEPIYNVGILGEHPLVYARRMKMNSIGIE